MLRRLAGYLEPSIEGLRGNRPRVRKVRQALSRAQHNLLRGPTTPLRASRNAWAARDLMDEVLKLKDKGLLDLPEDYDEGRIALENTWGYTRDELKGFRGLLRQVVAELADVGLYKKLVYGVVILDPDEANGSLLTRNKQTDAFVADPSKGKSKAEIYSAFGGRVWDKLFMSSDRQSWSTKGQFVAAFVKAMRGERLDSESIARLQVTVGRIAGDDWLSVAA